MSIPGDFPDLAYQQLKALVDVHAERVRPIAGEPTLYRQFALSHNAILWRFRSAVDADETYRLAYLLPDVSGDTEKRYAQERALFEFFAALVSTAEVLCYCSYAIAGMANDTAFPLVTEKDRRSVDPQLTKEKFAATYPTEAITATLDGMLNTYADANKMRNVLSHRGSPPRATYLGGPKDGHVEWGPFEIDITLTEELRKWLSQQTHSVVEALCRFSTDHLRKSRL